MTYIVNSQGLTTPFGSLCGSVIDPLTNNLVKHASYSNPIGILFVPLGIVNARNRRGRNNIFTQRKSRTSLLTFEPCYTARIGRQGTRH